MIDNEENLAVVMPMYDLLEYTKNYSLTSGSLWTYQRDEIDDVNSNTSDVKWFNYKMKIIIIAPERPANEIDANRLPVPTLNVGVPILL